MIAQNFERLWNFPHCIGAIDGRHMVIEVIINFNSFLRHIDKYVINALQLHFRLLHIVVSFISIIIKKKITASISPVFLMHIIVSF